MIMLACVRVCNPKKNPPSRRGSEEDHSVHQRVRGVNERHGWWRCNMERAAWRVYWDQRTERWHVQERNCARKPMPILGGGKGIEIGVCVSGACLQEEAPWG